MLRSVDAFCPCSTARCRVCTCVAAVDNALQGMLCLVWRLRMCATQCAYGMLTSGGLLLLTTLLLLFATAAARESQPAPFVATAFLSEPAIPWGFPTDGVSCFPALHEHRIRDDSQAADTACLSISHLVA
jgi:hypothetical protein